MTLFPVVERELQVAARKPATYRIRFFAALGFLSLWFLLMFESGTPSSAQLAKQQFEILGAFAFGGSLMAGIFLTADCLSSEKRDGTLGLLFLTDLKGYDVVLGKLVSHSVQAVFALLSILPILALPLLMGGVTIGEFGRTVLVLLTSMLLSLAVGLAVSAVSREARPAMALSAGVMIGLAAFMPAVNTLVGLLPKPPKSLYWLNWLSPLNAYRLTRDLNFRGGKYDYWISLMTLAVLGLICLAVASLRLPRTWQERSLSRRNQSRLAEFLHGCRFGSKASRRIMRGRALEINPFYWLAHRDRMTRLIAGGIVVPVLLLWLTFFILSVAHTSNITRESMFMGCLFTTFAFQLILKVMVASESSQRFSEDRESGALELLLSTPLTPREILSGQHLAIWRQFGLPLAAVLGMYGLLFLRVCTKILPKTTGGTDEQLIFGTMIVGNCVCLLVDTLALTWVGMRSGMRMRHPKATLLASALVIIPGWLVYILLGISGFIGGTVGKVAFGFTFWFCLCVGVNIGWTLWAGNSLRQNFAYWAAGLKSKEAAFELFRKHPPSRLYAR